VEAVTRLHGLGIAHCDVSAENAVLRTENGKVEVVLLDFAMAIYDTDLAAVTGARGKQMYRAPETLGEDAVYDARLADLFACGVVGYVLAIGCYPWETTAGGCKAFAYAQKHGVARFFDKRTVSVGSSKVPVSQILSPGFRSILLSLLNLDPQQRCNAWACSKPPSSCEIIRKI